MTLDLAKGFLDMSMGNKRKKYISDIIKIENCAPEDIIYEDIERTTYRTEGDISKSYI